MFLRRAALQHVPCTLARTQHIVSHSVTPAIAASSSSSSLLSAVSFLPPLHSQSSRAIHNPRSVRGVGPAPRTASFYKQPWLRRRIAAGRKKTWSITHPTPILSSTVTQHASSAITLPTRSFLTGEQTETVTLNPSVFAVPLRRDVIWEVVRWQRACRRQGTHKEKGRSEVFGSGKKARPQKGTGRARMGDPHAPHHYGGGVTWPRRPHNYSYALPQQIINLGKRVALSAKAAEGNLFIIDQPILNSSRTHEFRQTCRKNGWGEFLMIHLTGELDPNLALASRRFPTYDFISDSQLNVYDIVKAKRLVITRRALQAIEWRLNKANHTGPKNAHRTMRWMVGSYGGGYTRDQIEFVKPTETIPEGGKIVPDVDLDGLKLLVKDGKSYEQPIHWP